MQEANRVLEWLNLILFTGLSISAARSWLSQRSKSAGWIALTFGTLAFVSILGRIVPVDETGNGPLWATKITLAMIVLFPWALFRFTGSFKSGGLKGADRIANLVTLGLALFAIGLPDIPSENETQPAYFKIYL